MLSLGEKQTLYIVKKEPFGVYLAEEGTDEPRVLLPAKQVPDGAACGDMLKVFLYRDSQDRLIATTNEPKLCLGEVAALKVKQLTRVGAFLDWGLEKDLLLPFAEQIGKVRGGDEILVRLYKDKSDRLCASMRELYHQLSQNAPYKAGDEVSARIYEFSRDFGTFAAVDDKYSAMFPAHEDMNAHRIGDVIIARVLNKKEDGKLDISARQAAYREIEKDAERLFELMRERGGALGFGEKASPERIFAETRLSKKAFKRALGRLYKERLVEIHDDEIVIKH